MANISDLTYKIVALSEVPEFNTDECVDWAFEMVNIGYESPTLLMLAGFSKPTNYFQTIGYLEECMKELELEAKTGDQAIISYSSYFIRKLAKSENVKENLTALYKFCQAKNYEKKIFDFYLLYWAWDDLDNGINPQHYWPEANPENIVQIVFTTALKWLSQYESDLKLQLP